MASANNGGGGGDASGSAAKSKQDLNAVAAATAAELIRMSSSDSIYGSLANFDIDRKIGKGQFSVVYRARCKRDERHVALKKVQIFEMMDAKARLDCMQEIRLLQVRTNDRQRITSYTIRRFSRARRESSR